MLFNKKELKQLDKQISGLTNLPKLKIAQKQFTLSNKVKFSGVGLHSGKKINMTLHPSDENTGIIFRLRNKHGLTSDIKATYNNVSDTFLCTTLKNEDGQCVSTTEHLLSSLYSFNIDNLIIEIDNNEIPILDGSSRLFFEAISKIGFSEQNSFKKFIKIKKPLEVIDDSAYAKVIPNTETIISCEINFPTKVIGKQSISFPLTTSIFKNEISSARTFGFLNDINYLRGKGLTLGGSLDNAIVISEDKVLNKGGLRFNDEFVRHKALDFIGDLALSGHKMIGSFLSVNGGHTINYKLVKKIFSCRDNWDFVDSNQDPIF